MLLLASLVLLVGVVTSVVLGSMFRLSVKREAPDLYERFWCRGRTGAPSMRTNAVWPFITMILLHRYPSQLAAYPRSRAWASWMFVNDWIQVIATAVVVVAVLTA
jgi:hypothetical protein